MPTGRYKGRTARGQRTVPRTQEGFILVAVQVFVVIAFIVMLPSYERLHEALRVESEAFASAGGTVAIEQALGVAVARLQTGVPASDDVVCTLDLHDRPAGASNRFRVHYTKTAPEIWQIQATTAAGQDPDCPSVFQAECPVSLP